MSNNSNKVRLDIRTRYFCELGKQPFFDLRVFDPNPSRYHNSSLQQYHVMNEQERNRTYNERMLQIDHGTLHLRCFESTAIGEKSGKVLLAFGTTDI